MHVGAEGRGGSGACPGEFRRYGYLHLSVGLEDPEELIKDISDALDETFSSI
ncbi:hypothetical protein D3C85_1475300 [compost metagenome]